ncbi:protein PIN-LIKES 2 [Tanacetum coccineum]
MVFFESQVNFDQQELIHAVVPLLKLLCLTVIGILLAHPRTQIVPKATFKLLSKLVFALFLPCTIFIHLGQSVSLENLALWWFIPVNMSHIGTAYVSLAQWVSVLLVYTLVYHMMEPPMEYYEVVDEDGEIEIAGEVDNLPVNDLSRPLLHEAEWPGMEDKETEHCKTPFIARVFANVSDLSQTSIPDLDSLEDAPVQPRSPKSLSDVGPWWMMAEGPNDPRPSKDHSWDCDRMFQFVLLLQYTTPSAILFGAIASLRGYALATKPSLKAWEGVWSWVRVSQETMKIQDFPPSAKP